MELGQYTAILTSHLVNNPYVYVDFIFWYSLILLEKICLPSKFTVQN